LETDFTFFCDERELLVKYPKPLKSGSRIAICAFSSSVPRECYARLDRAVAFLQDQGFDVIEGKTVRDEGDWDAKTRANELNMFLLDEHISAVLPPWGGDLAMAILPLLDWHALQKASAKWVLGFSDVSTVMTALTTRLNWVTVHATNLMQLTALQADPLTCATLDVLSLQTGDKWTQSASTHFEKANERAISDPDMVFNLTEVTQWRLLPNQYANTNASVSFSGRLIGGCLDTHQHILNTEFADIDGFSQRYTTEPLILYFENGELTDNAYIRALLGLKYKGVFNCASGILIGRNGVNKYNVVANEKILLEALGSLNIPIVYDVDIGHSPPNMTLLNGVMSEVSISSLGASVVQFLQ
jgi:muramoyltetrapeptide carboxypeptidase LdcA involved in peptidoglycan recycling